MGWAPAPFRTKKCCVGWLASDDSEITDRELREDSSLAAQNTGGGARGTLLFSEAPNKRNRRQLCNLRVPEYYMQYYMQKSPAASVELYYLGKSIFGGRRGRVSAIN